MQTAKTTGRTGSTIKKLLTIATTGAIAIVPFLGAISTSEARPSDGQRYAKNDDNRNNRNNRRERRQDRRNDRRNNNNEHTLVGEVVDVKSDQRFTLRTNNGSYNVHSSSRLPRDLDRGDYVRAYGRVNGDRFEVSNVAITRNR